MTSNGLTNLLGYGKIVGWIQSIIEDLLARAADRDAPGAEGTEFAAARATRLFVQALYENSILEMDWLWYAANMTRDIERCYCLKRAIEINPHSTLAHNALAKLPPQAEIAEESARPSTIAGANAAADSN